MSFKTFKYISSTATSGSSVLRGECGMYWNIVDNGSGLELVYEDLLSDIDPTNYTADVDLGDGNIYSMSEKINYISKICNECLEL